MIEVVWSATVNDQHLFAEFGRPTPEKAVRAMVAEVKPGKIILLHDGYGTEHHNAKADKSFTVQILPPIIERLQQEGYRFVTVPELLNAPAYTK